MIVDYEPLEAVIDPETAFDDDAPLVFEAHGDNTRSPPPMSCTTTCSATPT